MVLLTKNLSVEASTSSFSIEKPATRWVHFITLGCARNRVDSEVMLGTLFSEGWSYCDDPGEAEMIVINTCGFIEASKEESIDTILEMAEYKKHAAVTLVVAGCLTQRYKNQLVKSLPEVDLFVGSDQFARLGEILQNYQEEKEQHSLEQGNSPQKLYARRSHALYTDFMPRINTLHSHCAYVKIAEGCDHQCAFCIIPAIRGKLRSRSVESIVKECENLAAGGVGEINLIAQDLAAYGGDRGRKDLLPLLRQLVGVEGISWIRLLYMYPENISEDFLDFLALEPKMVPYLDIPMQHGHSAVLERMNRGVSAEDLRGVVAWVRDQVPSISLRTSVMVGFPGESEEEFQALYDFVAALRFDHLGCFKYSQEAGTRAGAMKDQVEEEVKLERQAQIMELQRRISKENLASRVGSEVSVLVERPYRAQNQDVQSIPFAASVSWQGRLASQAPEVDGLAYIRQGCGDSSLKVGDILTCVVEETSDYDVLLKVL